MRGEVRHVLMTADAVGGVWTYALDLARALAADDIRVTLATLGPPPAVHQLATASTIPGLDLVVGDYRLEWMDAPWDDVARAGTWLLELERQLEPDIVHVNGFAHGSLPFRVPTVVVGHSCVSSWAEAVPNSLDRETLGTYQRHVQAGLHGADHVVAPSAVMLDALQRHYGPLARTSVIANGRCDRPFAPAEKEPFLFTAGRLWDQAKNVSAVAAVAADLPWPVFVAGSGNTAPDSALRALGSLPEVEIAGWLARASVFVLPARYEPFGLLPLEAALSGCALVLGDIPSLREVWGDAAEYVDPDDRAALRSVLMRTMEPSRLQERSEAARARAGHYTAARMGRAYRALYEAVSRQAERNSRVACAS